MTIVSKRHSGNLLAGIQKNSLDTGLRRYDELTVAIICVDLYLAFFVSVSFVSFVDDSKRVRQEA